MFYQTIIDLLKLTFERDILWSVLPLALATFVLLVYFQFYQEEKGGWNTYLSNSLVLLFVSIDLLRRIYSLDGLGAANYLEHMDKSIAVLVLFSFGFLLARLNFEHLLPERFASHLSSPITINFSAYAIILFVYSSFAFNFEILGALIVIVIVLSALLGVIKFPLGWFFRYVAKQKEKSELKDAKELTLKVDELKRDLKYHEKVLKGKKEKDLDKEKEKVVKMKKVLRKEKLEK
tara:strand:+ start:469 stop:1170 length:702 start_codon:yes stop_codon:yes gene_type:complete